jgi:hypothetical protein
MSKKGRSRKRHKPTQNQPQTQSVQTQVKKKPKPPVIFFISAGRTDLKILVTDQDGRQYPDMLPKFQVREFHQALLDGQVKYTVNSRIKMEEPEKKLIRLTWKEGRLQPKEVVYQNDGETVILLPSKLAETTQFLRDKFCVRSVIIFNTHRGDSDLIKQHLKEAWNEEPIALGMVLSHWLKDEFGLQSIGQQAGDIGLDKAGWVNILEGDMLKSGPGRDYPIHRDIIRKIDEILCSAASWEARKLTACLATSGGLPELKDIIKACATYRFGYERVLEWQEVEYRNHDWVSPSKENTPLAESFRARDNASRLIRQGDFAGAYSAVKHLETDTTEQKWINKIKQVADYFAGKWPDETQNLPSYLRQLIEPKQPRCLLVGLRAEAALNAGRIPEAIGWTSTFLEAAILDAIEQTQPVVGLDENEQTIEYRHDAKPESELINEGCLTPDKEHPHYGYKAIGVHIWWWLKILKLPALEIYNKQLSGQAKETKLRPRKLRNINTHSLMKPEIRKDVRKTFVNQGLWADNAEPKTYGHYFLKQSVVNDVFQKLGIADAAQLYVEIVDGLCQELADYDFKENGC